MGSIEVVGGTSTSLLVTPETTVAHGPVRYFGPKKGPKTSDFAQDLRFTDPRGREIVVDILGSDGSPHGVIHVQPIGLAPCRAWVEHWEGDSLVWAGAPQRNGPWTRYFAFWFILPVPVFVRDLCISVDYFQTQPSI